MTADVARLRAAARDARRLVLQMARLHGHGHPAAGLAASDLLAAIALHARTPGRDRLVCALPAAEAAHHAVLALAGAFDVADLAAQASDRPGVDLAPAHGLAGAVGLALAAKQAGTDARTWVVLGAEACRRGAVWEAALVAAEQGLGALVAVVLMPGRGDAALEKRFRAFGWHPIELNGHDMDRIVAAIAEAGRAGGAGKPVAMLAATTPGQGVSFMLDDPAWRDRVPDAATLAQALAELGGDVALPGTAAAAPSASPAPAGPVLALPGAAASLPAITAGLRAAGSALTVEDPLAGSR